MTPVEWLQSFGYTATPVTITIRKKTWSGVKGETQRGTPYIYAIGALPNCYKRSRRICFRLDDRDWFIASYCEKVEPQHEEYHPFGPAWFMHLWEQDQPIDYYETPRKRIPVKVKA